MHNLRPLLIQFSAGFCLGKCRVTVDNLVDKLWKTMHKVYP